MIVETEQRVTVIGAGIVGLIAAYSFHKAGFGVSVIDAGPNLLTDYDRTRVGTTYRGGNARHVSATETSPHASLSMNGKIYVGVAEGGWLGKDPGLLDDDEKSWMADFDRLTWKTDLFDRFTETVIGINNQGKNLWRKLMLDDPKLFEGTNVQSPATIFFLDEKTFQSETLTESQANPTVEVLSSLEVKQRYPALEDAVSRGIIAGGLIVDSFALNAISFCRNVIRNLQDEGVDFTWNLLVDSLEDTVIKPGHVFISTGALRQDFLKGIYSNRRIMGVVGVWIKIPNPGLNGPIKIATPYPTGYINGTIEDESLLFSGGYGFIGHDSLNEQGPEIGILFNDLKQHAENIFPESYAKALKDGTLDPRACIRPMKASGLGIFEVMDKGSYKVIFAGGNNAGGFTQAPAVANAALEVIRGGDSSLRTAYSSDRLLYKDPLYP